MIDAYRILNLSPNADDAAIKDAYMTLVQAFSPDRYPEIFKKIRAAYECIATAEKRLEHNLFDLSLPDQEMICTALMNESGVVSSDKPAKLSKQAIEDYLKTLI